MILLFMLGMGAVSVLLMRLIGKSGRRRDPFKRRPGRSDGVRTVYKRHS
jgi:hypothetical protein